MSGTSFPLSNIRANTLVPSRKAPLVLVSTVLSISGRDVTGRVNRLGGHGDRTPARVRHRTIDTDGHTKANQLDVLIQISNPPAGSRRRRVSGGNTCQENNNGEKEAKK